MTREQIVKIIQLAISFLAGIAATFGGQAIVGAVIVAAMLTSSGCAGLSIADSYRDADAATYKAVAPEYARYVEADQALTPDDRQRKLNTVGSWALRLRKHGAEVPDVVPPSAASGDGPK